MSIFYKTPNIHRFLHLPRGLVYIYSRPKSSYDGVTWGKRRITTYNVTPTLTRPSRLRAVRSTKPILKAAPTYVYSHIPSSKNRYFKNFLALSEGPRGSTSASSNYSPRATYRGIFFPPLQLKIKRGFYSGTPNSNVPIHQHHVRIPLHELRTSGFFSRLSTTILTLTFTQALPPQTSNLHQCHIPIPLLAVRTIRYFPASLPRL